MITKHAGGSALRWMAHSLSPILAAVSAVSCPQKPVPLCSQPGDLRRDCRASPPVQRFVYANIS